jgi:putative ATPase
MSETKKRKMDEEEVIEIDDDNVDSQVVNFSKQKCPVCSKLFHTSDLTVHVHFCLQTSKYKQKVAKAPAVASTRSNKPVPASPKAMFQIFSQKSVAPKQSEDQQDDVNCVSDGEERPSQLAKPKNNAPLAEVMRPSNMEDYFGQTKIVGDNSYIRKIIENNLEFPSLVLWGPPGTGKTTLANIIETKYKTAQPDKYKFLKMSAALSGINDVKKIFEQAKNSSKYNIKTVLFLDEIHRFNKMQQDILLSHIEKGIITLICATTENPSFSVNAALLSRCRVLRLEKLGTEDVLEILHRALAHLDIMCVDSEAEVLTDVKREDGTKQ